MKAKATDRVISVSEIAQYAYCPYSLYLLKKYGRKYGSSSAVVKKGLAYHESIAGEIENSLETAKHRNSYIIALGIVLFLLLITVLKLLGLLRLI